MPVTARLSQKFYQKLGDDVTNELVEWLNSVDASYRQEFRDLFDAHFGRFDARLQQGLAELRGEVKEDVARLDARIEAQGSKLIAWSFGFWVANLAGVFTLLKLAGVL